MPQLQDVYAAYYKCARNLDYWNKLHCAWPPMFQYVTEVPSCSSEYSTTFINVQVTSDDAWFFTPIIDQDRQPKQNRQTKQTTVNNDTVQTPNRYNALDNGNG